MAQTKRVAKGFPRMPLGSAFLTQKFIIITAKIDENPESPDKVSSTELSDFHLQNFQTVGWSPGETHLDAQNLSWNRCH